uniref:Uncharacterized protein n=1 Tax=Meloidogyne incognita TaxID=6306 RepID=A0A914N7F6_MELIC
MFVLPTEVQLDGELARMKFNSFYFNDTNPKSNYDIIEPKSGVFSLTLNDQLKNKWQVAIDRSIPLLLHEFKPERTFVVISTEMIEIRCCLEHLFKNDQYIIR